MHTVDLTATTATEFVPDSSPSQSLVLFLLIPLVLLGGAIVILSSCILFIWCYRLGRSDPRRLSQDLSKQ
jgi:hypothetical protein